MKLNGERRMLFGEPFLSHTHITNRIPHGIWGLKGQRVRERVQQIFHSKNSSYIYIFFGPFVAIYIFHMHYISHIHSLSLSVSTSTLRLQFPVKSGLYLVKRGRRGRGQARILNGLHVVPGHHHHHHRHHHWMMVEQLW